MMRRMRRWWHDRHCQDTSAEHRHAVHGVQFRTSTGAPYYGRHFAPNVYDARLARYVYEPRFGRVAPSSYQPRHAEGSDDG